MKEALRLGQAVGILPMPMLRSDVMEGRLRTVPLTVSLFRPLGIIHRRRRTFHRAAQVFLDLLMEPPESNQSGEDRGSGYLRYAHHVANPNHPTET